MPALVYVSADQAIDIMPSMTVSSNEVTIDIRPHTRPGHFWTRVSP